MTDAKITLEPAKSRSIDINFVNVSYTVRVGFRKLGKRILKDVSGRFKSGQLTAIMGPSGAGKTSLFQILTGFCKENFTGDISYVGDDGPVNFNEYRKALRYIQQEDKLYPTFTVTEVMRIAAELKLGASFDTEEKMIVIKRTLKRFDLTRVEDVKCDMLSGGQRKRLSIAVELLDNPSVVFLDEPTTGLDSSTSKECITTLKTLAKDRRTVVCVVHQPSAAIYETFDQVYFLAEGRCVYQGEPVDTVPYFEDFNLVCPLYHNPADYVIEVISNEYGLFNDVLENAATLNGKWQAYENRDDLETDERRLCRREGGRELAGCLEIPKYNVLLKRSLVQLFRDCSAVQMKIIIHIAVGVLLGVMFLNTGNDGAKSLDNIRFILCTSVFFSYTTLIPAVLRLPLELPVLQKEHFNQWYHLRTYFAATNSVNIPFQILLTLVYFLIAYVLTGQPMEYERFFKVMLIGSLTGLTAESIGIFYGTLFNPINGTFFGAITLGVMVSLGGFLPLYQHMPKIMYNFTYLSFLRYSMEGLIIAIYGYGREKLPCPDNTDYCHLRYPDVILKELTMEKTSFWLNVGVLFLYFIVVRIVAFWTLKRRLTNS